MKANSKVLSILLLAAAASQASAATQVGDYLSFSGFGTFGMVKTDSDAEQFVRDRQISGAEKDIEYNVDSNLGLQLNAKATDWLSGTVQMLASHRAEENIDMEVQWAFVALKPIKGLTVRGGRMELPMFSVSDFRNVGYANTWVRPPDEVYALAMLQRLEGADLTYRLPLGTSALSISLLGGKSFFYGTGSEKVDVNKVKGANAMWDADWLRVRIGRVKGEVVATAGTSDSYTFSGIGVTVDRDNVVAQAEYVQRRSAGFGAVVDSDGWYVLGGYRFDKWLPYLSYGHTEPKQASAFHLSGEQTTIAVGVRWDAFASAAIKFQIQRVDTNDTSGISFVTPLGSPVAAGMPPTSAPVLGSVNVASLALDFVF